MERKSITLVYLYYIDYFLMSLWNYREFCFNKAQCEKNINAILLTKYKILSKEMQPIDT